MFHKSISQYGSKLRSWGIRKKSTAKDHRKINRCIAERAQKGKKSMVLIDGVVQAKEKEDREFARTQYREYGGMK
jgi:hypothetical protein